jgi:hypothetical protein
MYFVQYRSSWIALRPVTLRHAKVAAARMYGGQTLIIGQDSYGSIYPVAIRRDGVWRAWELTGMDQEVTVTLKLTLSADCMHGAESIKHLIGALLTVKPCFGVAAERVQILDVNEESAIYGNE